MLYFIQINKTIYTLTLFLISLLDTSGYYGQLKVRCGAASKNNISVEAGVIDSDYRGEIEFLICNNDTEPYSINAGDKLGQMVIL